MTTTVLASFPSPSQGVWYLGPVPIRAYALFIIAGIVVALVIGDRRWAARGGERGVIYDIALWAVPFGLIGGRLYHVITDWPKYFGDGDAGFLGALRIWDGGLGIWGAVALGGVGAWIGCRQRGIPLPAFGDAIAPGIILAQAIGRLGNYFNQELYGRPTDVPWALEIYERKNSSGVVSPDLANGVSTGQVFATVHPTFLYELLWNVLIFAVLVWVDRRFKVGHGRLFALYVAGYCLGRFWIELLRSDHATLIADIRVNSFTSTFVFIGAVVYIMVAPKGREDPETLRGKPRDGSIVDEVADELVAVAATSGVVAAAKAAGDDELGEPEDDSGVKPESAAIVEMLAAAAAEDEREHVAEADDVGGVGAVEGEDAVEAQEAAPEVHEAAVEGVDGAEQVAAEVAAEEPDEAEVDDATRGDEEDEEAAEAEADVETDDAAQDEADDVEGADEAEQVAAEVAAEEPDEAEEAEADDSGAEDSESEKPAGDEEVAAEAEEVDADDAGVEEPEPAEPGEAEAVGAVEGEDAVDAQEAAPEVHEAAVESADEAEEAEDGMPAEADAEDSPADELAPEAEDADGRDEASVSEGETPGEADADGEVEEAAAANDDTADDTEDADAVVADAKTSASEAPVSDTAATVVRPKAKARVAQAEERGGRLRRMFRRRNG